MNSEQKRTTITVLVLLLIYLIMGEVKTRLELVQTKPMQRRAAGQ